MTSTRGSNKKKGEKAEKAGVKEKTKNNNNNNNDNNKKKKKKKKKDDDDDDDNNNNKNKNKNDDDNIEDGQEDEEVPSASEEDDEVGDDELPPIGSNALASRFLIDATRGNVKALARQHFPDLINYCNKDMVNLFRLDFNAMIWLDNRGDGADQTQNNMIALLCVPVFRGSGALHREIRNLIDSVEEGQTPLSGLNDRCIQIRKQTLRQLNELLGNIGLFMDTCIDVNDRKTFAQHKLLPRRLMMSNRNERKVQAVKCHIASCPHNAAGVVRVNRGENFCVSCTNVFQCGEAYNGICSTVHCYMIHYLTENINTVIGAYIGGNEEEIDVDEL